MGNHAISSIWGDPKTGLAPQDCNRSPRPRCPQNLKSKIQNGIRPYFRADIPVMLSNHCYYPAGVYQKRYNTTYRNLLKKFTFPNWKSLCRSLIMNGNQHK